jgi:hypothetical protein
MGELWATLILRVGEHLRCDSCSKTLSEGETVHFYVDSNDKLYERLCAACWYV